MKYTIIDGKVYRDNGEDSGGRFIGSTVDDLVIELNKHGESRSKKQQRIDDLENALDAIYINAFMYQDIPIMKRVIELVLSVMKIEKKQQ